MEYSKPRGICVPPIQPGRMTPHSGYGHLGGAAISISISITITISSSSSSSITMASSPFSRLCTACSYQMLRHMETMSPIALDIWKKVPTPAQQTEGQTPVAWREGHSLCHSQASPPAPRKEHLARHVFRASSPAGPGTLASGNCCRWLA